MEAWALTLKRTDQVDTHRNMGIALGGDGKNNNFLRVVVFIVKSLRLKFFSHQNLSDPFHVSLLNDNVFFCMDA